MFNLEGKTALITGSTQGIGFAIAKCLADYGAKVFVHGSINIEKCKNASSKIQNSTPVIADLSQENCSKMLYEQTGDIDILVLNASVQYRTAWNEITSEEFDRQIQINFKSTLKLIQTYAPYMQKRKWGRIVTIGSVQQYKPHREMAIYAGTKSAQMNLVTNLAKQLAPYGITVNNMAPGVIATPRNKQALSDEQYSNIVLSGIPVGFIGQPNDCVGGVLLFCSNEGRYITGTDLIIDGGMHI